MNVYQCRSCTALFTNPPSGSCPACEHSGPGVHDVSGNGNGYDNNWYCLLRDVDLLVDA